MRAISWLGIFYICSVCWISLAFAGKIEQVEQKNQPHVVVFLSKKCPCSKSHHNALKELADTYQPKGIEFIGVHSNQDEMENSNDPQAASFFKDAGIPFAVLTDLNASLAKRFKALKTPHVYFRKGSTTLYEGGVDDSADSREAKHFYLKNAIDDFLAGREIQTAKTRTLGCRIKR